MCLCLTLHLFHYKMFYKNIFSILSHLFQLKIWSNLKMFSIECKFFCKILENSLPLKIGKKNLYKHNVRPSHLAAGSLKPLVWSSKVMVQQPKLAVRQLVPPALATCTGSSDDWTSSSVDWVIGFDDLCLEIFTCHTKYLKMFSNVKTTSVVEKCLRSFPFVFLHPYRIETRYYLNFCRDLTVWFNLQWLQYFSPLHES